MTKTLTPTQEAARKPMTTTTTKPDRISSEGELTVREGREVATDYPVCTRGAQCLRAGIRYGRLYHCTREVGHTHWHVAHSPQGDGLAQWQED